MRILNTALFFGFTSALLAQSPITLGNSNMPSAGDTLRYTSVSVNSVNNYTQTGTNFTWNFAAVTSGTQGLRSFRSAFSTPYALFFASFTGFAEKMPDLSLGAIGFSDYYNFYKKQTNPPAYIADGVGMTFSAIPLPSYYSNKDEIYNFPLTYPKYDSTTYKFSTPSMSIIPIVYTSAGYRVTKVDGWGTVTTPYGTENCLRLVTTVYGNDSIKNTILPFPLGFPNITRSYQWLTLTSKIPYFEVSGNLVGNNFVATQARYRGFDKKEPPVNTVGINQVSEEPSFVVYPNPVSSTLHLGPLKANAQLAVYDLSGKLVLSAKGAEFDVNGNLELGALQNGIYLLTINEGEQQFRMKFVKE